MQMALQPQRVLSFRIKPAPVPISQPLVQCKQFIRIGSFPRMAASPDYSKRRPRKSSVPKTKVNAPKGFSPKPQVGTGTQKKVLADVEGKEEPGTSHSSEITPSSNEFTETKVVDTEQKPKFGSECLTPTENVIELEVIARKPQSGEVACEFIPLNTALKIKSNMPEEVDKDLADVEGKEEPGTSHSTEITPSSNEFTETKVVDAEQKPKFGSECLTPTENVIELEVIAGQPQSGEVACESSLLNTALKIKSNMSEEVDKDLADVEGKEEPGTSHSSEITPSTNEFTETKAVDAEQKPKFDSECLTATENAIELEVIAGQPQSAEVACESSPLNTALKIKSNMLEEVDKEKAYTLDHMGRTAVEEKDTIVSSSEKVGTTPVVEFVVSTSGSKQIDEHNDHLVIEVPGTEESVGEQKAEIDGDKHRTAVEEKDTIVSSSEKVGTTPVVEFVVSTSGSKQIDEHNDHLVIEVPGTEESVGEQKAEIDGEKHRQMVEDLAEKNHAKGNKVFVIPEVVKPDQVVKVFLNRSSSALKNEHDIFIKGAFNGWRRKSFNEKMHKADLEGDWWFYTLYVPREAYKVDFVFFNGGNVYENNNYGDFCIEVDGGMDESSFQDLLLEEKRRELQRLAAEHAERERQAEEQRRRDAEKAASEADRAQAKAEVDKKREAVLQVTKLAKSAGDVWLIEPSSFKGGDMVRLHYNCSSRSLAHATEIWIHGGHNNWSEGLTISEKLLPSQKKDGDWWYVDVIIPGRALIMDWVFANGPPQSAQLYDNNSLLDFHATVPMCVSEELFWVEEEHRIYRKLQEERKLKEEAFRRKADKTALMKTETKKRTMKAFLLSLKHIVYTEPLDVRAGSTVTVFYNPSNTVLNGKPDVWFRYSFNHWTHRDGPLPPQKMVLADNGSHLKVTVRVPIDAYSMDFVFSEKEEGGIYDNKNMMDYHIPVDGGILKEPPMHIVHIAIEMAPIAKVGGLGDVVTSLSRAVQDFGHNVDIILPKYDIMNLSNVRDFHFHQSFSWGGTEIKVWFGTVEGLSTYFLEPSNGMFSVGCIYGRNDGSRFSFFCHAALEFLLQSGSRPDILHCHDWSSAPVAGLFKEHYMHYGLSNARVIFTIHNLEFGVQHISKAMIHADKATTVSRTYSKEVSGNPVISPHLNKFHGIVNGIDPDIWDPYNDNFIPVSYTSDNVVEGKKAAKLALQETLGLKRSSDHPLVGIITRLTAQKGIHLIKHAILRTLECDGQVVLLGSAPDHRIQNDFINLANQLSSLHGDRVRLCLTYDEPLSHLIYAGSDFILVPSIFEPCGLTQLISFRYGSIPIVRRTGGLRDTVFDVDNDKERAQAQGLEPNGFCFDGADSGGVDYALNRAITGWYKDREWFNALCNRVMEQDWSWNRPALDYMELYHAARK